MPFQPTRNPVLIQDSYPAVDTFDSQQVLYVNQSFDRQQPVEYKVTLNTNEEPLFAQNQNLDFGQQTFKSQQYKASASLQQSLGNESDTRLRGVKDINDLGREFNLSMARLYNQGSP